MEYVIQTVSAVGIKNQRKKESIVFLNNSSILEAHPESFDKCAKGMQYIISAPLSFHLT